MENDTSRGEVCVDDTGVVYVRRIAVVDLPENIRNEVSGSDAVYALHRSDGSPLALARDRSTAFWMARQNDMMPVSVH